MVRDCRIRGYKSSQIRYKSHRRNLVMEEKWRSGFSKVGRIHEDSKESLSLFSGSRLVIGLGTQRNIRPFFGNVPLYGSISIDLCEHYDHLLLSYHWRSTPPCEEGGEGGVSRLLLRRHHITVWQERVCYLSGRQGGWAVFRDRMQIKTISPFELIVLQR